METEQKVEKDRLAVGVWLRLMKSYNLILRQARRSISTDCTLAQFDVLAQLARHSEGLSFRQLSEELLVTAGNLTGIVDRLEAEGLVVRNQVPEDRRSFQVKLTESGQKLSEKLIEKHTTDLQKLFAGLSKDELLQLRDLLGKLQTEIEKEGV
jgi:DNA-binding MarR family transcriptional regulator